MSPEEDEGKGMLQPGDQPNRGVEDWGVYRAVWAER